MRIEMQYEGRRGDTKRGGERQELEIKEEEEDKCKER